jgi:hypothetical protein
MFAEIAFIAVVLWATLFVLWFGGRIVWTAIRTGRLRARGAIYDRDNRPGFFYGLIVGWFGLFALLLLASAVFVNRALTQWT